MKKQTNLISRNLTALRQYHQYSQEEVAEKVGVTRQSVAKWESGETVPDILNCDALAELYDVSVDALIHHDQEESHMPIPPKGKHLFGTVKVGDRGQVVLPKRTRDLFHIKSGTVTMLGKDFYGHEKECKQDIGVVFGGIDFYPLKKLSAITAVTRQFYKDWDQERYTDYLRQFSLDEGKQFRSLSNGMKVKYLLALALSHHATLYLLDEPTSGLDPVSRDEILHIFTRIVKDGKRSVLFSTHITSDLDRCADDITYIKNGTVLTSADKETFFHSFEHLRTDRDTGPLSLEKIMLRTEGSDFDETAL